MMKHKKKKQIKIDRINRICQLTYYRIRKRMLEARAAITGTRFYCSALSGQSSYNICVNCDMTVSCNCQDFDGSGCIGDLNDNSFEEVLGSPKANQFRRSLVLGKLPLLTCASCAELRSAAASEACFYEKNWHVPTKGFMVENTVVCPYECTACSRMLVQSVRKKRFMNLQDIRTIATILQRHSVESLSFFNLGETFAVADIYDQLSIIRELNPNLKIAISTNGILLDSDEKREAALLADHIIFSIHGVDDHMMRKYQRGASFFKAYENLRQLVEYRSRRGRKEPVIEWKYLLFNWNDRERMILAAMEMARKANVDIISFCPTKSPFYGISWRYYLKGFYKTLGESSYKGKEVHLSVPQHPESADKGEN